MPLASLIDATFMHGETEPSEVLPSPESGQTAKACASDVLQIILSLDTSFVYDHISALKTRAVHTRKQTSNAR